MNLAYDVCRCMGQNGFVICAERDTCARYLAAKGGSDGERVPYTGLMRSNDIYSACNYKIEVE